MTASLSRVRLIWTLSQGKTATFPNISSTLGNHCERSFTPASVIHAQLFNTAHTHCQHRQFSTMGRPIVYQTDLSPPSRAVRLAAAAMGLDIEVRNIELWTGQHLTEEFKKMNPEHTLPTLDDDGFYLWDSHAIMCYLVDKYGKDDSLYPKDLRSRALVNQRLHFETGVLFARLRLISFPLFRKQTDTVSQEKMNLLDNAYQHLNKFLEGKEWLAGDSYTLADISCVPTVSSLECYESFDDYPNIRAWLKRCEENLPRYAEINNPGNKLFHDYMNNYVKFRPKPTK